MDQEPIEIQVVYVQPDEKGWLMICGEEKRQFATASGAIFEGIQHGRKLARTGAEVWVMWRNGEAWSVTWTSDDKRSALEQLAAHRQRS